MTDIYDTTCLFNGTWFDTFNCLVVASNYVLLYVLYVVLFIIILGIFSSNQQNTKNSLLIASVMTSLVSILLLIGAAASSYSGAVIRGYSSATIACCAVSFAVLMYHILSDL